MLVERMAALKREYYTRWAEPPGGGLPKHEHKLLSKVCGRQVIFLGGEEIGASILIMDILVRYPYLGKYYQACMGETMKGLQIIRKDHISRVNKVRITGIRSA